MIEKFKTPYKICQPSLGKAFKVIPCAPEISLYADADTADEETNPNNSFYYVTLPYRGNVLSQDALGYGQQHGDALIFDEKHGQIVVEYELLRAERRCNAAIKNSVTVSVDRELKEISMHGSYDYPDYFGPLSPPALTPYGIPTRCINAAHGVYFLEAKAQLLLSVDYLYWSFYDFIGGMTLNGISQARDAYEPMFFTPEECAPTIYTLLYESDSHEPLWRFVKKDALIAALHKHQGFTNATNQNMELLKQLLAQQGVDNLNIEKAEGLFNRNHMGKPTTTDTDFLLLPH